MNVVSVMAHQDDELMCLGTMLKLQAAGHKLSFICITDGSKGMVQAPDMPRKEAALIRQQEMSSLAESINAEYICLGEEDEFLYDNSQLRIRLIDALRRVKADVIFTHFEKDYNLDHMTVNSLTRQCAMQAPFPMIKTEHSPTAQTAAVFMVEPSGGFEFEPTHFVDIGDVIDKKMLLAKKHKSQDEAFLAAFGEGNGLDNWVMKAAEKRGYQCSVPFAEGFRPMLARGLVKPYAILP